MIVEVTNYGGTITSIMLTDDDGNLTDVVLGFDSLEGYLGPHPCFGTLIGRYGNRIGGASFKIDGQRFDLPKNDGENTLHGGDNGFDKKLWTATTVQGDNVIGVELSGMSPDGDEGFPGNLEVTVSYLLDNENALTIEYEATTDKATVVNLTNHAYFNLRGEGNGDILAHEMTIYADSITEVDQNLIPTGKLIHVENTPLDFRKPAAIGERIDQTDNLQMRYGAGYDHNYVLHKSGASLQRAARVYEPLSGRTMEVFTTEPGVQLYTGNFLDGIKGKGKKPYGRRSGFCLETQHFPDSPNKPTFPSTLLRPGKTYHSTTVYRFQ